MSKRKPINKDEAKARRDRLLQTAGDAELALTEGVREMRAIAGMTQEEFARHRGVSARVIKAIELDQGNPTVATLNRIGELFGLEVAFVPKRRVQAHDEPLIAPANKSDDAAIGTIAHYFKELAELHRSMNSNLISLTHQMDLVTRELHESDAKALTEKKTPDVNETARPAKKSAS